MSRTDRTDPYRVGAWRDRYRDLNRQANRLASRLAQARVRPGDNVALFAGRSIPMVLGILATLKAGAAYVPQDVRLAPEPALQHVVSAASTRVILTLSSVTAARWGEVHVTSRTGTLQIGNLDLFCACGCRILIRRCWMSLR